MRKIALLALLLVVPVAACGPGEDAAENTSSLCQDQVDNDDDGAIDCDDSECSDFAFCANNGTANNNNGTANNTAGTNNTSGSNNNNGTTANNNNNGTTANNNNGTTANNNNGTANNTTGTNNSTGSNNTTGTNNTNNNTGAIRVNATIAPNVGEAETMVDVNIEFTTLENLMFNPDAIGMDHVVGEGHYHVFWSDGTDETELLESGENPDMFTVDLTDVDPAGMYSIVIRVHKNDHTEYQNPIEITIPFDVTAP